MGAVEQADEKIYVDEFLRSLDAAKRAQHVAELAVAAAERAEAVAKQAEEIAESANATLAKVQEHAEHAQKAYAEAFMSMMARADELASARQGGKQ